MRCCERLVSCLLCSYLANILLQNTIERIHVGQQFGDIPRGIFLVRGENMVLCGELVGGVRKALVSA